MMGIVEIRDCTTGASSECNARESGEGLAEHGRECASLHVHGGVSQYSLKECVGRIDTSVATEVVEDQLRGLEVALAELI